MRIKELKKHLSDYGAVCRGCTSKKDFVDLLTKIAAKPELAKKYAPKKKKSKSPPSSIPDALIEGTSENFNEVVIQSTIPVMVEFFAPWCGHCKNLEPHWKAAATQLYSKVKLVTVDATIESELASQYGVSGYPTIKVFMPGEDAPQDYKGGREEDGIVKYGLELIGQQVPKIDEADVSFAPNELIEGLKTVPKALIAFTTYSCGKPCDRLKKNFMKVIKTLKKKDPNPRHAQLFLVDCTPGGCEDIQKYPHVVYFENAKRVAVFERSTSTIKLLGFAKRPSVENAQVPPPEKWGIEGEEAVPVLTSANFKGFLNSHPSTLVFFYAPWCGHCKTAKPGIIEAAVALKEMGDDAGSIAAIDCTAFQSLCSRHKARAYPTILYFKDGKKMKVYTGDRDKEGYLSFFEDPDKKEVVKEEPFLESGDEHTVAILTDDTMKPFISQHPSVLVMFYAPWCGHCKKVKPAYVEAADVLEESGNIMAAVDCTVHKNVCSKYDVKGYPTIKYFKNGKPHEVIQQLKGRDKDSFVSFMMSQYSQKEASSEKAPPLGRETPSAETPSAETPDEPEHDEL